MKENKFSWFNYPTIITVILLMLIEAFVFYISMIHANSVSALGYVSFAGTIVSIILALVAIFYSIAESQKQSNVISSLYTSAEKIENATNKMLSQQGMFEDVKMSILDANAILKNASEESAIEIQNAMNGLTQRIQSIQDNQEHLKSSQFELDKKFSTVLSTNNSEGSISSEPSNDNNKSSVAINFRNTLEIFFQSVFVESIPFMALVLAGLRKEHFYSFSKTELYKSLVSNIDNKETATLTNSGMMLAMSLMYRTLVIMDAYELNDERKLVFPRDKIEDIIFICDKLNSEVNEVFDDELFDDYKITFQRFYKLIKIEYQKYVD